MANYKDKKKLIDDNPDVYISDYDKNLDYSYLSDIIDQKKAYSAAEKAGDASAMKKANEVYYQKYLKPEMLVKNSLELAEKII